MVIPQKLYGWIVVMGDAWSVNKYGKSILTFLFLRIFMGVIAMIVNLFF